MLSATQQLIGTLDEFEVSQQTGESPSPAQIRELFRLRDQAKAEIAALAVDQHTELDPPPAGEDGREMTGAEACRALEDFVQDAPAVSPRSAVPSHPAEGAARVGQGVPSLDDVAASLDRAVAATSRVKAKPLAHWYRTSLRTACMKAAIRSVGHVDDVVLTSDPAYVTCRDCRRRLEADRRRKFARPTRSTVVAPAVGRGKLAAR